VHHVSLSPKWHLDLFFRFCRTDGRGSVQTDHATASVAIGHICVMQAMRLNNNNIIRPCVAAAAAAVGGCKKRLPGCRASSVIGVFHLRCATDV